jgi:hypothetical protein
MVSVFYLLSVLPLLMLSDQGLELTPALACLPVVNVALLIRDAFNDRLTAVNLALVLTTSLLAIAACVMVAARVLRFEDALGASGANVRALVRERLFGRGK